MYGVGVQQLLVLKMTEKTPEEYRDIIFILKDRLQNKQNQYQTLNSQYSSANVFEETNFDWKLREKLLQVELEQLNNEEKKHSKDKASDIYGLHFAILKLIKACDVLSISKEMVFRGADIKMEKAVDTSVFQNHLWEVIRLPQNSITHITRLLSKQNRITMQKYYQLLQYFHLLSENKQGSKLVPDAVEKLVGMLVKERIKVDGLWSEDYVNAVSFAYQIMKELKGIEVLECMAVYYQLNPLRKADIPKREVAESLSRLMEDEISKEMMKPKLTKRELSSSKKVMMLN